MARPQKHVLVCTHSRSDDHEEGSCTARGGKAIADKFAQEFESRSLWGRFKLNTTSCLGVCEHGPSVLVYPEGVMYGKLTEEDIPRIVETHLLGDQPVDELKVPADAWE